MTGFRRVSADDVRRLIATTILGEGATIASDMVGRIELRAHQVDAAERLVAMIEHNGGAMLAEPVGVGKTYTAVAVAIRLGAARVVVFNTGTTSRTNSLHHLVNTPISTTRITTNINTRATSAIQDPNGTP